MQNFFKEKGGKQLKILVSIITLFLLLTPSLSYGGFRCGKKLITIGDNKLEVLAKCGEPDLKEIEVVSTDSSWGEHMDWKQRRTGKIRSSTKVIETWIYNMGAHRFMKILRFEGSKVISIDEGDYGFDPKQ